MYYEIRRIDEKISAMRPECIHQRRARRTQAKHPQPSAVLDASLRTRLTTLRPNRRTRSCKRTRFRKLPPLARGYASSPLREPCRVATTGRTREACAAARERNATAFRRGTLNSSWRLPSRWPVSSFRSPRSQRPLAFSRCSSGVGWRACAGASCPPRACSGERNSIPPLPGSVLAEHYRPNSDEKAHLPGKCGRMSLICRAHHNIGRRYLPFLLIDPLLVAMRPSSTSIVLSGHVPVATNAL